MPPRLPIPSSAAAFVRSFSSTTAAALPPRDSNPTHTTHSSRLSNLSNSSHSHSGGNAPGRGGASSSQRGDSASRLLDRYKARSATYIREKTAQMEFLKNQKMSNDYLRQMPRRWQAGDVYSPHDLSPIEMQKWRKRSLRNNDVVDALGINPLDMYKNFSLIDYFTTPSGMINHSKVTRLRPVNQRKVAKMIRRVQGMGLYPTVHAHPEMLRDQFYPVRR
ncbi:ribosomal protein S18 [Mariannaea sp. PMI_226]|nr:ribosomal protein S18 [Mariannaea sp. PMI_226]